MNRPSVHIEQFSNFYFIGIGGIGMSAIARYFHSKGWNVSGYDKTPSPLIKKLEEEGVEIHFEDKKSLPSALNSENTLVIYTPAIPKEMGELMFAKENNFTVLKRAEVLGLITRSSKSIGVAGTHGKTTTSTMLAHILDQSNLGCSAFLGGISANFNSNFVFNEQSDLTVIEADEFDRSFLQLDPFASIITSTDADHLDIYGDSSQMLEGFQSYVDLTAENGFLVYQKNAEITPSKNSFSYGINLEADFSGSNLQFVNGFFQMDVCGKKIDWKNVQLGLSGVHNAENALACIVVGLQLGLSESEIRSGLKSFLGVKRRFEYHVRTKNLVYIDDYAHHPTEIKSLIDSVRMLYPKHKIVGAFQPHLFTRTRDFFDGFVEQLSRLDETVLLPIYPARELPIEGITSDALLEKMTNSSSVKSPQEAIEYLGKIENGIILTIGAGDIDRIIEPLKSKLEK